jgi:hypothetical protein
LCGIYPIKGLVVFTLALLTACGAATQADTTNQAVEEASTTEDTVVEEAAPAVEESASEVEEVAEEEAVVEEETVAESSEEVVEEEEPAEAAAIETETEEVAQEEAMAETDTHSDVTCEDPFAGVDIRFAPQVWTAEGITRFVGTELVDPESGLETNFCKHSVDYSEILSGGPPPDGIPPLDNPTFDPIEVGDEWLADVQPVISLVVDGEAKAYPLGILTRHEIANDEIAGVPVAVTFCPLCNSAVVFNREVDGEVLRFGVSGNLRNSDLVMWDNKTLSWWQQLTGEAIVGDMTGTQLEFIPAQVVAWKDFKAAYPDGQVLSSNGRNYNVNPYTSYDSTENPFLFLGEVDRRLRATERVLGYHSGDTSIAYPLSVLREERIVEDTVGGMDVVVFYEPGQVSALDQSTIDQSKEVGSAAMYLPEVDGQKLTFTVDGDKIVDNETGSEWNVFGQAIAGELEGAQMEQVLAHPHFWFAWAAFRPDTEIYGS